MGTKANKKDVSEATQLRDMDVLLLQNNPTHAKPVVILTFFSFQIQPLQKVGIVGAAEVCIRGRITLRNDDSDLLQ